MMKKWCVCDDDQIDDDDDDDDIVDDVFNFMNMIKYIF